MSDDYITFNIRFEKALFELRIKTPGDVSGFTEKLVNINIDTHIINCY